MSGHDPTESINPGCCNNPGHVRGLGKQECSRHWDEPGVLVVAGDHR